MSTRFFEQSADRAMDCVNIKISKFGGLTKARQARDLCLSLGLAMTIEDSWGGDIVTAAIASLAHSTPPRILVYDDRFQQLRDPINCRGCSGSSAWPHGRQHGAGLGDRTLDLTY